MHVTDGIHTSKVGLVKVQPFLTSDVRSISACFVHRARKQSWKLKKGLKKMCRGVNASFKRGGLKRANADCCYLI